MAVSEASTVVELAAGLCSTGFACVTCSNCSNCSVCSVCLTTMCTTTVLFCADKPRNTSDKTAPSSRSTLPA